MLAGVACAAACAAGGNTTWRGETGGAHLLIRQVAVIGVTQHGELLPPAALVDLQLVHVWILVVEPNDVQLLELLNVRGGEALALELATLDGLHGWRQELLDLVKVCVALLICDRHAALDRHVLEREPLEAPVQQLEDGLQRLEVALGEPREALGRRTQVRHRVRLLEHALHARVRVGDGNALQRNVVQRKIEDGHIRLDLVRVGVVWGAARRHNAVELVGAADEEVDEGTDHRREAHVVLWPAVGMQPQERLLRIHARNHRLLDLEQRPIGLGRLERAVLEYHIELAAVPAPLRRVWNLLLEKRGRRKPRLRHAGVMVHRTQLLLLGGAGVRGSERLLLLLEQGDCSARLPELAVLLVIGLHRLHVLAVEDSPLLRVLFLLVAVMRMSVLLAQIARLQLQLEIETPCVLQRALHMLVGRPKLESEPID